MDFENLRLELQKRSLDLGQAQRPDDRYGEALNNALSQYPRDLWELEIDGTTLDTIASTRDYVLFGITGLYWPNQVRRVWVDDANGIRREVGRFEVIGTQADLTLVLDYTPSASRDITVEYRVQPEEMTLDADPNPVDDEWLLAKALVSLLGEADPEVQDPALIREGIEYWYASAMNREAQLLGRRHRSSVRGRTENWRGRVT